MAEAPGEVISRASEDSHVPAVFLDGYPEILAAAAVTGRQPGRDALDSRRSLGVKAAEQEIALRSLVDAYLRATALAWEQLPGRLNGSAPARLHAVGASVLTATNRVIAALAEGYECAERLAVRREEAARREFIDDLLSGHSDLGQLADRAERFGLRLASAHVVAVARGTLPFTEGDQVTRRVEGPVVARFGAHNVLVTTREGQLVCLAPSSLPAATGEFAQHVGHVLGTGTNWQVGVGRVHAGTGGVVRSYQEACGALDLAERLGLRAPVVDAASLLVFPVLLRDRAAITDLVVNVLGPLQQARGGPEPLLATLDAFFACHGNASAAARRLGVSVRAVSYRLERVRQLTGQSPSESTQRFTLETAVLGARLLDWPAQPLEAAP